MKRRIDAPDGSADEAYAPVQFGAVGVTSEGSLQPVFGAPLAHNVGSGGLPQDGRDPSLLWAMPYATAGLERTCDEAANPAPLKRHRGGADMCGAGFSGVSAAFPAPPTTPFLSAPQQGTDFFTDANNVPFAGAAPPSVATSSSFVEDANLRGGGGLGIVRQELERRRRRSSIVEDQVNQDPDRQYSVLGLDGTPQVRIGLQLLTGHRLELHVDIFSPVAVLKELITEREGIPAEQQRLVWNGRLLANDRTLHDCGIGDGDVLHLMLALRGGAAF